MHVTKKIVVLDSIYDEEGQRLTRILDSEGNYSYFSTSVTTTLNRYLLKHGRSTSLNRQVLLPYFHKTKLLPIYVSPNHVLIPFRHIIWKFNQDLVYGYVCRSAIHKIVDNLIYLHTGQVLQTVHTPQTLYQRRQDADRAHLIFSSDFDEAICGRYRVHRSPFESFMDICEKKDIA